MTRLVVDGTMRRVANGATSRRNGGSPISDLAGAGEFFAYVAAAAGIDSLTASTLLNDYSSILGTSGQDQSSPALDVALLRDSAVLKDRKFSPDDASLPAECPVCLCAFTPGQRMKLLPCSHAFCTGCTNRWLGFSARVATCPLCRTEVKRGSPNPAATHNPPSTSAAAATPLPLVPPLREQQQQQQQPPPQRAAPPPPSPLTSPRGTTVMIERIAESPRRALASMGRPLPPASRWPTLQPQTPSSPSRGAPRSPRNAAMAAQLSAGLPTTPRGASHRMPLPGSVLTATGATGTALGGAASVSPGAPSPTTVALLANLRSSYGEQTPLPPSPMSPRRITPASPSVGQRARGGALTARSPTRTGHPRNKRTGLTPVRGS